MKKAIRSAKDSKPNKIVTFYPVKLSVRRKNRSAIRAELKKQLRNEDV